MDYMQRAIELARRGTGSVNPNPLVGAVIVKDGSIIGEGWHERYGGAHAEINAFKNAICDVEGADMYVTLEPCAHYGKTPPCARAIAEHKIKRVFIGMRDPNPLVAGKGIKILEDAGIEVVCGVHEDECKALNPVFLKYITTGRPFVVMKCAMSLDGKIATCTGRSKWISSELSRSSVQQMRHALPAIMVGINTVLADNPRLTCRIDGGRSPIKIIVDSRLRVPENALIFENLPESRCIIAVGSDYDRQKAQRLTERGAELICAPSSDGRVDLNALMDALGKLKIDGILLEGGGTLNFSALKAGIADMAVCFIAPLFIGGSKAKTPVEGEGFAELTSAVRLENMQVSKHCGDLLVYGTIRRDGNVYGNS